MKFPRFHLSTLLLMCVFAGAVLGLYVRGGVWQPDYFLSYGDNEEVPRRAEIPYVSFNMDKSRLIAVRGENMYVFDTGTQRVLKKILIGNEPAMSVDFLTDGDELVAVVAVTYFFEFKTGFIEENEIKLYYDANGAEWRKAPNKLTWGGQNVASYTGRDRKGESLLFHGVQLLAKAFPKTQSHLIVVQRKLDAEVYEDYKFDVGQPAICTRFSFDGNHLAVCLDKGIAVWRRARSYEWKGYFELPLFWIAAVSLLALIAIFVRRLARWIRGRAPAASKISTPAPRLES